MPAMPAYSSMTIEQSTRQLKLYITFNTAKLSGKQQCNKNKEPNEKSNKTNKSESHKKYSTFAILFYLFKFIAQ
jgi:hypothetical protein